MRDNTVPNPGADVPLTPSDTTAAHARTARTGVLLINLGTPDAPTAPAIRRYLRQFLSDRRVVEVPRPLWWLLLNLLILPFRPRKLVTAYGAVWGADGSPLLTIGRAQQSGLQAALGPDIPVALAMTYGEPSLARALADLRAAGVQRLLALPLYPQYSATTTAAAMDALYRLLMRERFPPALRMVRDYHDDPGYIAALAASVRAHWARHGEGTHLLMSFHGIPQRNLHLGDPYYCHCHKTARLLADALSLTEDRWSLSFQSRLGRMPWLQPYTDDRIRSLAGDGCKQLDVICPGFSADCLETLEEVSIGYDHLFREAGGEVLRYIPALNAEEVHLKALEGLVRTHLQGWPLRSEPDTVIQERLARVAASQGDAGRE